MNESQIEDFEKFCAKHFPRGALLAGFMPDGSLHTLQIGNDEEAEAMYEWLSALIKEEVEGLSNDGWEDEP